MAGPLTSLDICGLVSIVLPLSQSLILFRCLGGNSVAGGIRGLVSLSRQSVQFSRSVVSHSLQPLGLQHARLPCPSPTPRAHSNSCPWNQTISPSVIPFFSCLQSFPVSGSFPMSQFLNQMAKVLEFQFQHQFFQ